MGASPLLLSSMSTASTLPFFLFTLPAGALADMTDRRRLMRVFNCWLAVSAGLLAVCAFANKLTPEIILGGVFLLGIGFSFQAPVSSAAIPEIVGKEDLPSATALGGVQMNLAGIIGPAVGGLLIPWLGVSGIFAVNAVAFVLVLLAVNSWPRKAAPFNAPSLRELFRCGDWRDPLHALCTRRPSCPTPESDFRHLDRCNPSPSAGGWPESSPF